MSGWLRRPPARSGLAEPRASYAARARHGAAGGVRPAGRTATIPTTCSGSTTTSRRADRRPDDGRTSRELERRYAVRRETGVGHLCLHPARRQLDDQQLRRRRRPQRQRRYWSTPRPPSDATEPCSPKSPEWRPVPRDRSSTPTTIPTTPTGTASCLTSTAIIGHDSCREEVLRAGLEATKVAADPDYGNLTVRPPDSPRAPTDPAPAGVPGRAAASGPRTPATTSRSGCPSRRSVHRRPHLRGRSPLHARGLRGRLPQHLQRMRELAPEALLPGHGPVRRGEEITRMLDEHGRLHRPSSPRWRPRHTPPALTPLEAARQHRTTRPTGLARRVSASCATCIARMPS